MIEKKLGCFRIIKINCESLPTKRANDLMDAYHNHFRELNKEYEKFTNIKFFDTLIPSNVFDIQIIFQEIEFDAENYDTYLITQKLKS